MLVAFQDPEIQLALDANTDARGRMQMRVIKIAVFQLLLVCEIFRLQPLGMVSGHTITADQCLGVVPGKTLGF